MRFLFSVFSQTFRNLAHSWRSHFLTLLTIMLSVLIFAFFYLVYLNVIHAGQKLDDDLRLIVYLDENPSEAMKEEYTKKIQKFDDVEQIVFVTSKEAYDRFALQLDENRDVLNDMPEDFLPPSIEVYPVRTLNTLSKIKRFSDYLYTLPGVLKVQYGREWVERFYSFIQLLRIVVILSGTLLIDPPWRPDIPPPPDDTQARAGWQEWRQQTERRQAISREAVIAECRAANPGILI